MKNGIKQKKIGGALGLLCATLLWGFSFVVVKDSTSRLPVMYLLAMRYSLASLGMIVLFGKRLRQVSTTVLRQGAVLGSQLFVSQFFQTLGCKHTTAGKNAFLTAIYVVLVPFLGWWLEKQRPGKKNLAAAVLALTGIGLLSLQGSMALQLGDGLTLVCSLGLALHIVFIARYTQKSDPVLLTLLQFAFAGLYTWSVIAVAGVPFPMQLLEPALGARMVYIGICSTMTGFLLQTTCQKYTSPNLASVILSMEAVFGMVFSVILLKEPFTIRILAGAVCMLASMLLAA
ncbi:MAG: DMT family transporter [Lachnospiraceae bacterium]|nr:DMT family transporter [Lachnospiraceae bacterium]